MGKTGTKRETSILILSSFSLDAQGEEGAQLPWDAQPSKITPNENDILTSPSKLSLHRISWTVDILKEAGKKSTTESPYYEEPFLFPEAQ